MVTIYEQGRQADILLIDDNLGDIKLLEIAFRRMQLPTQMRVAVTAEQGFELVARKTPKIQRSSCPTSFFLTSTFLQCTA